MTGAATPRNRLIKNSRIFFIEGVDNAVSDEQLKVRVSHQKYSGKKEFREICRGAISSIYAGRLASWTERFSLFASTLPEVVLFLPTGNIDAWRYAHTVASSQTRHVVKARSFQSASERHKPSSTHQIRKPHNTKSHEGGI